MSKHKYIVIWVIFLFASGLICGCSSEEKTSTEKSPSVTHETRQSADQPPAEIEVPKSEPKTAPPPEGQNKSAGPTAEIVLKPSLWENPTKPAVKLTHEKHIKTYKIACKECHHVYEEGKNIWDETMPVSKCETCHNEPTVEGVTKLPPEEKKKNLKLAFHENCRTCHKALKKEDPESQAPVTCSKCHIKSNTVP